jgi:DNA-binding transcriptional ArsR family regulator
VTALYESRDLATSVSDKLKIYAQPQRLMILSCLLRSERNVAEIGAATGIGQPALSQQLAELRRADLVCTRKEAKQVWYSLANDGVGLCVQTMESVFCGTGLDQMLAAVMPPSSFEPSPGGVAAFARVFTNGAGPRAGAKA